jgi:hypothetical protein
MEPTIAPTGAKSLSAAPSLEAPSVETGPSPLEEVLVGSVVVELSLEPRSKLVPVLSAADEVLVLSPPGMPLLKSVLELLSALLVRVLPLLLPLVDAWQAATSSSIWKARWGQ